MAKYHELMSGEKIKLSRLTKSERKDIRSLERRMQECGNSKWNGGYLSLCNELARATLDSYLQEGKVITRPMLKKLHDTDFYKLARDLFERYCYRYLGKEFIKEHKLWYEDGEEEYAKYLEQPDGENKEH